jgi:hypothetical protein
MTPQPMESNVPMYLIEVFFWKDQWIEEEPSRRMYGTKEQSIAFLQKEFNDNKEFNPEMDLTELTLSYSTDDRRHHLIRCFELQPITP